MTLKHKNAKSEEVIFYLDLITDFIKRKTLQKAIEDFVEEKNKFTQIRYGIVMFQDNDNPITKYGQENYEFILNTIKNAWENRETSQSYFENGLFEVLSHCLKESRTSDKIFRVIVLSDMPSTLPDDYHNALYDILLKIKPFSIYIDIIRLGDEKFYPDDVKLKVITNETNGGTFYCQDQGRFSSILNSLIQPKEKYASSIQDLKAEILEEDKTFYEKLAAHLLSLTPEDDRICILCEQESCPHEISHSTDLGKCYNCSSTFHFCCAADYSIEHGIGPFKHIFRCPKCETLLNIEEETVKKFYKERFITQEEVEIEESIQDPTTEEKKITEEITIQEKETKQKMKEKKPLEKELEEPEAVKKVRIGGFFGKEVMFRNFQAQEKEGEKKDSMLESVIKQSTETAEKSEKLSITSLKPPKKKKSIQLCPICGSMVKHLNVCPTCGSKLF
jgi:hypothetical protein